MRSPNPPRKHHFFFAYPVNNSVIAWLKDNGPWRGSWTNVMKMMIQKHSTGLVKFKNVSRITLKNFTDEELAWFKLTWAADEVKTRNGTHVS